VVEAAQGAAAIDQVRSSRPQLVITDPMMPRSGGDELIELLRADESTAAIPILIISGTRSGHPGADATLRKRSIPATCSSSCTG
jgi:CheY-like chemotaxis protein